MARSCRPACRFCIATAREIAGEVLELTYDAEGALRVEARVELPAARSCNGFSIGLGPVDVEWFNVDDPRAFFVAITRV
jgi:hypothetical protein